MKTNLYLHKLLAGYMALLLLGCNLSQAMAQDTNLLSLSKKTTWAFYDQIYLDFETDYKQRSEQLLTVFNDHQAPNLNRLTAAYYLGLMRVESSAPILAREIGLEHNGSEEFVHVHISIGSIPQYPAVEALVKIGNPSIPAVIKNLAESDDAQVRNLSLQVLYRIDGDKDISQLRLQKALAVEKDSQRQARLQTALKALAEASAKN